MNRSDIWTMINMHGGDIAVCWEWRGGYFGRTGHRMPSVSINGKSTTAYRVVYEEYYGSLPPARDADGNRMMIRHICDRGKYPTGCCNPHHMVTGTQQQNTEDMLERDRHGLSAHTIRIIKKRIALGHSGADIARDMGIARQTVSAIKLGTRRASVTTEDDDGSENEQ